jgi:hypothetical protein
MYERLELARRVARQVGCLSLMRGSSPALRSSGRKTMKFSRRRSGHSGMRDIGIMANLVAKRMHGHLSSIARSTVSQACGFSI